ncbi:MAG: LptF/LptG family permease [Bacteroidales bacterium]|nr:LptF/LptG family permease [Bacteroidales bacterium]
MRKIDWYIFKKFIGTFFFAISLLIVVVIVFDVSENVDSFIKNHASLYEVVFHFYIPFIPYFINLFIYLFTFISVIFFTSKMAGHTEIIAILSSGISFRRFLWPYMMAALLLAGSSFYLGNFLIPRMDTVRRNFKNTYMENLMKSSGSNIHVQIEKGVYAYMSNYDLKRSTGYRFTLEKFDNHTLEYKISADKIVYDTMRNKWTMYNYFEHTFVPEETIGRGKTKDTVLMMKPSDFYFVKEDFEEMNLIELTNYIEESRAKGADNILPYEIEKHKRLASPAAIIILTIIGASLSSRKTRGGMGINLGIGITITFAYILFLEFFRVFAISGVISPFFAGWLPNIIFAIIGIYFLAKAPK